MPRTSIKIENLGKKYLISHQSPQRYIALRDVIMDKSRLLCQYLLHPLSTAQGHPMREEFWALRDISLNILAGERIGIIGRNGAGKSTLLKLLSRITEPTQGRISLRGRITSLLEIGTGFHPELTGRENIFLNGAILGMTRSEIRRSFDAIVDFSGMEKFLDTPVKHYSSGMHVRLAFAVAAHLSSEILIIDEALAVGDAEFQKKCMAKMDEVSHKEGRTILFVSHNMDAIQRLCTRGIYLQAGRLCFSGPIDDTIQYYFKIQNSETPPVSEHNRQLPIYSGCSAKILSLLTNSSSQKECKVFKINDKIVVDIQNQRPNTLS